MPAVATHTAQFPEKLEALFTNSRYKVVVGGRGKGASWGIARALLILGNARTLRILCTREIQKSIKDSIYQLLVDQIGALGLADVYQVTEHEIYNRLTGTMFIFAGLQDHTVESIKSYEGIDIVHVAEGQTIKKRSWDILIPTIRKEGSEIWIDMNPELDTDESYQRFLVNRPPNCQVIEMTYRDNPFFPSTLEFERQHAEKSMTKEDYENIWEGRPRTSVPGAIFAKEVATLISENRYTFCPYDPTLRVHTFWDMGWNDKMAIVCVQKQVSECRVIKYLEGSFKRVDEWAAELNKLPWNWGYDHLPPDGYTTSRQTGQTDEQILLKMGRRVRPKALSFPEDDREVTIRATRNLLPKLILNRLDVNEEYGGVPRLLECLKRYKRAVPKSTNEPAAPLHDEHSHGCAALGGVARLIDRLTNEGDRITPRGKPFQPSNASMGVLG